MKSAIKLGLIMIICSSIIIGIYTLNETKIISMENEETIRSISKILKKDNFSNLKVEDINEEKIIKKIYVDNEYVGYIVNEYGYGGEVQSLVIIKDKKIVGMEVLKHTETPGISDKALSEDYLSKYIGLSSVEKVETISGATITSSAIKRNAEVAIREFENEKNN